MPFSEGSPGKGTIGSIAEDPDYWWRKSALYRSRRAVLTVVLVALGVLLLGYAASPLAPHRQEAKVLSRSLDTGEDLTVFVVRVRHEGVTAPTRVLAAPELATDPRYRPGQVVTVTTGGLSGDTSIGDTDLLWSWVFGGLLVLLGLGRVLWDRLTEGRLHYYR